jgi:glyoxylase-like metal-dependent hydrolase (beta-lactamase superfamily II)
MKISLIQQATVWVPERLIYEGGSLRMLTPINMGGILVEHPTEGYALVDSGFGSLNPPQFLKAHIKGPVDFQISDHGISLTDIKHVIFTHLHFDNVGNSSAYPNAHFWTSQKEVKAAQEPLGIVHNYLPSIFQWEYRLERLAETHEIDESIAPFMILKDLFRDGSVLILSTPGHSPGSISVLVRSQTSMDAVQEGKKYLLCGDATYTRKHYREGLHAGSLGFYKIDRHKKLAFETRKKILEWEQSDPSLEVIPLHDHELWSSSPLFPESL